MWRHCAPVDERIVVSEIGEQWSPITEPERIEESTSALSDGSTLSHTAIAIGMRMPNVPHEVPVEKAITAASRKSAAGRTASGRTPARAARSTEPAMNESMPSSLLQIVESVHASTRMMSAETIMRMPAGMHAKNSR